MLSYSSTVPLFQDLQVAPEHIVVAREWWALAGNSGEYGLSAFER